MAQLGLLVSSVALLVLGLLPERMLARSRGYAGAAALLVWAGSLTGFVFGEDDYIADGSSRWSNRGSTEHGLFVAATTCAVAVAVVLAVMAARGASRGAIRAVLVLAACAAFVVGFGVMLAFAAN